MYLQDEDLDIDNFTDEDFENFDDFAHDAAVIHQSLAPQRRAEGSKIIAEKINPFLAQLDRLSEIANKPKTQILVDMLRQDPSLADRVCQYLEGEGYEPASNFDDLAAQAAYARANQIAEMQDEYCNDNFDEADCLFGKKNKAQRQQRKAQRAAAKTARQAARQKKKQAKQETKIKRKVRRGELVDAKFNRKIAQQRREQEQAEQEPLFAMEEEQMMPEFSYPESQASYELSENELMDLSDPTPDQAHAEIIGEELEEGYFDGDHDNFLPFLAGALQVGGELVSGAKQQGADFTNIKTLFGRKTAPTVARPKLGKQLPAALNAGIKEVVSTIEAKKKQDFLKENMIWIILAVVVIFFLGRQFK